MVASSLAQFCNMHIYEKGKHIQVHDERKKCSASKRCVVQDVYKDKNIHWRSKRTIKRGRKLLPFNISR